MAIANGFARTDKVQPRPLKGQAALVLEALDSRAGEPATVEALTKDIVDLGLVTRQAPDRITSYYLCIFKKQGLVRQMTIEVPDAGTEVVAEDVDETDDELVDA